MTKSVAFSTQEDIILIDRIKFYPVLYDITHENYKDVGLKDIVWNEISTKIGKSVTQCKRRWKNIKTAYMKNKKKLETDSTTNNWPLSTFVSFLDTNQSEQNSTSNIQDKNTNHMKNMKNMKINQFEKHNSDKSVYEDAGTSPKPSPIIVSNYLSDKLAQSKEKNTILIEILKQIETVNNKSETTTSLDLFFKSISVDMEDFGPRAFDEIKPKILKCVAEVREMYSNASNAEAPSNPITDYSLEENIRYKEGNKILYDLQKQIDLLNMRFENNKSIDLFFKSVSMDMNNFCVRAIDDVKLRILKCVSDVKDVYYERQLSAANSSVDNSTSVNLQPRVPSMDHNGLPGPSQAYMTYFNVPVYCNEPTNYNQSLF